MENVLDILGGVKDYAHRGCFDKTLPENSLTAIRIAADKGLGLEIDVHLTKDNKLVVFHDHTLKRMCGVSGIVEEMTESQLTALKLKNTSHTIPTLKDVLAAVDGQSAGLVDCKNHSFFWIREMRRRQKSAGACGAASRGGGRATGTGRLKSRVSLGENASRGGRAGGARGGGYLSFLPKMEKCT